MHIKTNSDINLVITPASYRLQLPLVGVTGEPKSPSDPPAEVASSPLCDKRSFAVSPGEKSANPLCRRLPVDGTVVDMPLVNRLPILYNDPVTGGAPHSSPRKNAVEGNQRYARDPIRESADGHAQSWAWPSENNRNLLFTCREWLQSLEEAWRVRLL